MSFGPDDLPDGDDDEIEVEGNEGEDEAEDAGLDDDEGGDEAEAGPKSEDAEGQEGQVERKPSRATRAVQEAKRLAREAQERATRIEQEMQALRAERAAPKVETEEQEQAKLALMTAEERIDYKLRKAADENKRQLGAMQFQMADATDKAAFEARGSYDQRYKRYAPDVEKLLQEERRAGRNFPRETILKFVLGAKVLEGKSKVEQQRKDGAKRIAQQSARADNGRSDRSAERTRPGRGGGLSDLEKRLDGVLI